MINRSKKFRIAFVGGGAHTIPSYRAMLKLLSKDYQIILYSEFYLGNEWKVDEYIIKSVPSWKMNRRIREMWFGLMILWDQLFHPADIIHSHSTFPSGLVCVWMGKIFKKPIIVSLDAAEAVGISAIGFGDLLHKKRTEVNQYVLHHAAVITALTTYQQRTVNQTLKIRKEVIVIPRGVDLTQFHFVAKKFQLPIRFLNIAYLHPVKDQETLLKAFAIICKNIEATLTLVGKDYMDGEMQKLCHQLGINDRVRFEGFIQHDLIQKYYEQADVLLHTSLYESQAVAVAEAFASGVLVCGTHVGLMADLSNECCITVPPKDHDALASAVTQLLNDQIKMNSLLENAKGWANEHDLRWTANQYKRIYKTLIQGE